DIDRVELEDALAEQAATAREKVENPEYVNWSGFKPGTVVVQRSVTEATGTTEVTTTTKTVKLTELTPDRAVVEQTIHTKRYDGAEINNPPETFTIPKLMALPPGVAKSEFGKRTGGQQQGEENVSVCGKVLRTTWREGKDRSEAGDVFVKVWTS